MQFLQDADDRYNLLYVHKNGFDEGKTEQCWIDDESMNKQIGDMHGSCFFNSEAKLIVNETELNVRRIQRSYSHTVYSEKPL